MIEKTQQSAAAFEFLRQFARRRAPVERCEMWLWIERRYLSWRGTGGIAAIEKGARWQRQRHVYAFPFYYIDYGLAICCALQIWLESLTDRNAAIEKWLSLCSLGGTLEFEALPEQVGISSPFKPGTLARVVTEAQRAA